MSINRRRRDGLEHARIPTMQLLGPTEPPPGVFLPLLARLRTDGAAVFGPRAHVRPVAYQVRPFSHVLRIGICLDEAPERSRYAFAKIFKPKPGPDGVEQMRRRVLHEFEATRAVHEGLRHEPGLDVVRPVACYPDLLALVTEEVQGQTVAAFLDAHARWYPGTPELERATSALARVGQWLRAFQGTDRSNTVVTIDSVRDYVDVRLQRLASCPGGLVTPDVRQALLAHIDALGRHIPARQWIAVPIHADFAPGNVMVSGDRVVVLDFAMMSRGTRLHDLTRLWMQLDLLTAKARFRPHVIAQVQSAMLAGYDQTVSATDPLFRLLSLLHRINHLGTLTLKPSRFPGRLLDHVRRRQHERWIRHELDTGA